MTYFHCFFRTIDDVLVKTPAQPPLYQVLDSEGTQLLTVDALLLDYTELELKACG